MKISNKVALVTGASEGIGKAIVLDLAKNGCKVIAISRNVEASGLNHENVQTRNTDVGNAEQVQSLADWIKQEYKGLDLLVNCAGIWQRVGQLEEVGQESIDEIVRTNLLGTIYVTKFVLPLLRQSNESAIVNIISKSGVVAQAGQSVYTATKYGVRGFTDVLREDLKNSNIHIMAVYQAGTNTEMFRKAGEDFDQAKFTKPEDLASQILQAITAPDKLWVNELMVGYK